MKNSGLYRIVSLFLLVLMLNLSASSIFAAENGNDLGLLAGRVLERQPEEGKPDQNKPKKEEELKPLPNAPVRITNIDTGESRDTTTNKNGCYIFKDVPLGTYSLLVTYDTKDFNLPDKIKIESKQKLFACLKLADNVLSLLSEVSDKNKCKCKEFPLLLLWLGGGGGIAAIIVAIHNNEEEVSSDENP